MGPHLNIMEETMKSAKRRHHYFRLKNAARKWIHYRGFDSREFSEREIAFRVNTPRVCSCQLCGNGRNHFGHVTLQEIRSAIAFAHDCKELGIRGPIQPNQIPR